LIIAEAQSKKIPSDVSETEHTSTHQAGGSGAKSKKQLKPTSRVQDKDTKRGQCKLYISLQYIYVRGTTRLAGQQISELSDGRITGFLKLIVDIAS